MAVRTGETWHGEGEVHMFTEYLHARMHLGHTCIVKCDRGGDCSCDVNSLHAALAESSQVPSLASPRGASTGIAFTVAASSRGGC